MMLDDVPDNIDIVFQKLYYFQMWRELIYVIRSQKTKFIQDDIN